MFSISLKISLFLILFLILYSINSNLRRKFKVIIFTMYFPIVKHHHSINTYIRLSQRYFNIVKGEVVFFTDIKLKHIAPKSKNVYSYFYNNVTEIPLIRDLKLDRMVKNNLNQIYHSKIALLYYVSTLFKANLYFFNDITTFHYSYLEIVKNYPNNDYLKNIFNGINNPILFTVFPNRYCRHFIQGGCFGGKKKAIKYFYEKYYSYLYEYNKTYGKIDKTEEQILDMMIYNISDSILLPNNPNNCSLFNNVRNKWFYYITVMSGYPKQCVKHLKLNHLIDY